ncbi:hypothetical protein B0H14DRAFT_3129545 [Mycena olivaceomarginata]|nr:hypothetical protein B0H14DRAFT_3129545 [Mycena olivaceomarginata]
MMVNVNPVREYSAVRRQLQALIRSGLDLRIKLVRQRGPRRCVRGVSRSTQALCTRCGDIDYICLK